MTRIAPSGPAIVTEQAYRSAMHSAGFPQADVEAEVQRRKRAGIPFTLTWRKADMAKRQAAKAEAARAAQVASAVALPTRSAPCSIELPKGDGAQRFDLLATPKQFKSGNNGWWGQQRFPISDSVYAMVQVTIVLKEAKDAEA